MTLADEIRALQSQSNQIQIWNKETALCWSFCHLKLKPL
jgi:hypothetical protein